MRGAERGRVGQGEVASGCAQSGRLVRDTRGEAFGPSSETGLWPPAQAGAGHADLDAGHVEVTADTVGRMSFRSGPVSELGSVSNVRVIAARELETRTGR